MNLQLTTRLALVTSSTASIGFATAHAVEVGGTRAIVESTFAFGPDKLVSATIAALALILGCYNLIRSIQAAKEVRTLMFAQRKKEALDLVTAGEASALAVQSLWRAIHGRATLLGINDIASQAEELTAKVKKDSDRLAEAREAILATNVSKITHEELVRFIEVTLGQLGDLTNASKQRGLAEEVLQEAELTLKMYESFVVKVENLLNVASDTLVSCFEGHLLLEELRDNAVDSSNSEVEAQTNDGLRKICEIIERLSPARDNLIQAAEFVHDSGVRESTAEAFVKLREIVCSCDPPKEIKQAHLQLCRSLRRQLAIAANTENL